MGQRFHILRRRGGLGLLTLSGLLTWYSCTGGTEPSSGTLTIVTTTHGVEPDPDGFTVTLDEQMESSVPSVGSLRHENLAAGAHTVLLAGIAPNCVLDGPNPRTIEVGPGSSIYAEFLIGCSAGSGTLEIRTVTSGTTLDPDGYLLLLDGGNGQAVGVNGSITIPRVSAGTHALTLQGVAPNCTLVGGPGQVLITAGQQTTLTLSITCRSAGSPAHTGILFGMVELDNALLSDVQTGTWRAVTPETILAELSGARARGARLILKLVRGDRQLLNPDGTFSLDIWKRMVLAFQNVNFSQYIEDGTVVGHYLIDEPHLTRRWGGGIPQTTVEEMARFSKQLWPGMTTMVRVLPSWLAEAPVSYTHLDTGWIQYHSRRGNPIPWLSGEVAIAKRLGLGVVVSMNALDGGTGASGIPGYSDDQFAMSAAELRQFGTAMLSDSYGCAFLLWMYTPEYYGRPDIQGAIADLSRLAKAHAPTSCRQ